MEKSPRAIISGNIKAENEFVKSYKVLINALKKELDEKNAIIQEFNMKTKNTSMIQSNDKLCLDTKYETTSSKHEETM